MAGKGKASCDLRREKEAEIYNRYARRACVVVEAIRKESVGREKPQSAVKASRSSYPSV